LSAIARRRTVALLALAGVAAALWLVLRGGSADDRGATVEEVTIESAAVGASQPMTVVTPEGAAPSAPLLVFLHGRDGDEEGGLVDEMFAALDDLGERAPVVAFPDGGGSSYWHDRDSGDWGRYVLDEVIPAAVEESGADPRRVAIGGISMGGFGAYDLAAQAPGRFCAVGGHAPAIWTTGAETAPGAFDDAEDFAEHDVITAVEQTPDAYTSQPLWIDAGEEDPFTPGHQALIAALESAGADLTASREPGDHSSDYWNARWDDYLRFYAKALARC
jgi:S-formylglutathione hydrolase FrmB